ncbi:MAG: heavy-metal-associated domain-containing protein [Actinomycetota bacterium]|nr:heavy-metal-associated domain-containing protein [Actinomycetota bacterium]
MRAVLTLSDGVPAGPTHTVLRDSARTAGSSTLGRHVDFGDWMVMETLTVVVPTMTCRHCVRAVTAALRDVAGVHTIHADPGTATVTLRGSMTAQDVTRALLDCGYPAQ